MRTGRADALDSETDFCVFHLTDPFIAPKNCTGYPLLVGNSLHNRMLSGIEKTSALRRKGDFLFKIRGVCMLRFLEAIDAKGVSFGFGFDFIGRLDDPSPLTIRKIKFRGKKNLLFLDQRLRKNGSMPYNFCSSR